MIQFVYPPGATPLDPDEIKGLIPSYVATQGQLNEVEAMNVAAAEAWIEGARVTDPLTSQFVRNLHYRMFDNVWKWAGKFRLSDKNIGVDSRQIPLKLAELLENTKYQGDHKVFPADELAARFHHRLVWIHCFPNGNGRHARLMTDVFLTKTLNQERFTWGRENLVVHNPARERYINALQAADNNDIGPLLAFVRS